MKSALGDRLNGTVLDTTVARVNFVNDTTLVELRWSIRTRTPAPSIMDASVAG